jgi:hypothetical protein
MQLKILIEKRRSIGTNLTEDKQFEYEYLIFETESFISFI